MRLLKFKVTANAMHARHSFYKTGKSAYFGEDRRAGCNTGDLCCHDVGFIFVRLDGLQNMRVQQESEKLRHCYGKSFIVSTREFD